MTTTGYVIREGMTPIMSIGISNLEYQGWHGQAWFHDTNATPAWEDTQADFPAVGNSTVAYDFSTFTQPSVDPDSGDLVQTGPNINLTNNTGSPITVRGFSLIANYVYQNPKAWAIFIFDQQQTIQPNQSLPVTPQLLAGPVPPPA